MNADSDSAKHYQGICYRFHTFSSDHACVVMIHGVGLHQGMWDPWIPILSSQYNVLTFDLYGHGGSINPDGARTVKDFTKQLVGLLDHLKIDRFVLVGFSLGAVISQGFASLYSSKLSHLCLLHSVYKRTEAQCEGVRARYLITRDQGPMATVELAIERWFSEQYRKDNPDKMDQIRQTFAAHSDDGYLKAYYLFSYAEPEMKKYSLEQVTCPALVITGSAEKGSTPEMSEALANDLPNAELIINPGHLHMAPAEHADLLSNQVLSFLNKY